MQAMNNGGGYGMKTTMMLRFTTHLAQAGSHAVQAGMRRLSSMMQRGGRRLRMVLGLSGMLALAGCGGGGFGDMFSDLGPGAQDAPQAEAQQPAPSAPATGSKVALLLPLSAPGATGQLARAMKNAAEMAMIDAGRPDITLVVKNTSGNVAGARAAAEAALAEGAQLILGPLLANNVRAVGQRARERGVPVIAFSSRAEVAGNGVYLMSFLPASEVDNVVRHAVKTGKKRIAALIPGTEYGRVVRAALKQAAQRHGARIVAEETYVRTALGLQAPAQRLGGTLASGGADALFFPEGPKLLAAGGEALQAAGMRPERVQLLGTGLWDSPKIRTVRFAQGGWYAGVDPRLVSHFANRYKQTYGNTPPRLASLAYDATSLAIALKRLGGFNHANITNREGFQGMNGLFRFRNNGLVERGLAILKVTPTGPQVVAPAPPRFSAGY